MADNWSGKQFYSFNRNRSRNQMNENRNFHYNKQNNQCTCFVEKVSKSVQTDDIRFVILPPKHLIIGNNTNSNNDHDNNNINNKSSGDNSSYQTCSSSLSSTDTESIPDSPKSQPKILPKSICKNRKSIDTSNDEPTETINSKDEESHMEIREKSPILIPPETANRDEKPPIKRRGKPPILIPAGYICNLHRRKNKNNENDENKHKESIVTEDTRIAKEINQPIVEQNRTEIACKCPNFCDKWNDCNNWKNNNLRFPNDDTNNPDEPKKSLFLKETIRSNFTITSQIIKDNSLIHGQHIPRPSDLSIINKEIQSAINPSTIDEITNHCWTIIRRNFSLFIIGQKQVGKYSNYLPSICSFSLETELYKKILQFKSNGPIIMILTPYQETSKKIYEEIQGLFRKTWNLPEVQVVTENTKEIRPCDILIIDTGKLFEFLQKSKLDLKRLCHLIIENLDIQVCSQSDLLASFLKILNEMLLKRPGKTTFQLIATSDMWVQNFEIFLKKLEILPIIIFNDCLLDVAVYSKLHFVRKVLKADHLKFNVTDTLFNHYQTKRIIIFCNDQEEICQLGDFLEQSGIVNFKILEQTNDEEIHNYEQLFLKLTFGSYKVLICSDRSFRKLQNVKNCDWLVHYAFSKNWDNFINRFKCMLEKFASPVSNISENDRCSCYFLINEDDEIAKAMYNNFMALYSKRVIDKLKF